MEIKQATLGLLDLPVEARLRIYHHIFTHKPHPNDFSWVKVDLHSGRFFVKPHVWPTFQICKQIYAEVMPEYYASTDFHFTALAHLRHTIATHHLFRAHVRHIVLNPNFEFPTAEELLSLSNLHTFAISNITCYEPIGTSRGTALDYTTLKSVLLEQGTITHDHMRVNKTLELRDEIEKIQTLRRRQVHLRLRFRYSYVEKSKHPDGWGGMSAKRARVLDYDCVDDVFIITQPDANESNLISPPAELHTPKWEVSRELQVYG